MAGFKSVLDNIDMNLRPRHQTFERHTQSIYLVNTFAVRDRINFSRHDSTLQTRENTVSVDSLLPSASDGDSIMTNFVILAGRIFQDSIPAL